MNTSNSTQYTSGLGDQLAQSADQAIKSTQRGANAALDSLAGSMQGVRQQSEPLMNRASEQVSAMAQRGLDSVRETSRQLRDQAQRASENTVSYIRVEPVKSILIAAATGAALMALVSLISRSRGRD